MGNILFQTLYEKYGASMPFEKAGQELSYPTAAAARQARLRGTFPVPVRQAGVKLIVSTLDVASFLVGVAEIYPPSKQAQVASKRGRPRGSTKSKGHSSAWATTTGEGGSK